MIRTMRYRPPHSSRAPRRRLLALNAAILSLILFVTPTVSLAKEDEETARLEARLEGYPTNVRMKEGSTALTWLMIGFLSAAAVSTMLKNAKRTHLD
jgi:hypothetical protein